MVAVVEEEEEERSSHHHTRAVDMEERRRKRLHRCGILVLNVSSVRDENYFSLLSKKELLHSGR